MATLLALASNVAYAQDVPPAPDTEPALVEPPLEALPSMPPDALTEPVPDATVPAAAEEAVPEVASEIDVAAVEPPPCGPGVPGCFLDLSGTWRVFEDDYLRLITPPARHYGIAAIEELSFVGVGAIWYFAALEDNKLDWDIDSLRQRFSRESVRYDSNTFTINFVLHPLSGAAYYTFPRANGLSVPASFAYGTVACLLWEFGLEFNERLSINDLITTPIGGLAIGEFFNRFARYLNSAPGGGNAWHRAFGYTLGVNQAFHDRVLDGRHGSPSGTVTDALGYDAAIAHRFSIDYGFGLARTEGDDRFGRHEVRVSADLIAIPGYLRPGIFSRAYTDANITRFFLRGLGGPHGNGVELHADAVLLGYYAQRLEATARGMRGFGVSIGSSVGYTYRRDNHAAFRDKLGITHLPGLAVDAHVYLNRVALHVRGRLHGEFAGVQSSAYPAWSSTNPDVVTKSVLQNPDSYYYAWGYSARIETELELPYITLGASAFYGHYASDEGLDRRQEEITDDVHATDRVVDAEAYVRVRPVATLPVYAELAAARRRRVSHVGSFEHGDHFERLMLRLGALF